ncbi:uncharacterized protein RJT20DRAFT_40238 [Scheffersomyces xylosifermentans]|uniref:uncharacterized protein n=1 Tax=Scheffersomyces xylosifermentans TaxID=1304137 RepID=UPI00315D0ADF
MAVKSKSSTPALPDESHPALGLSIGTKDQIATLSKLHPTNLSNQVEYNTDELNELRCSYKYLYVVNWLYNFRGYIRLQSELFDIDLFELELLNYFPSSPHLLNYDPESSNNTTSGLFVNKLKLALITTLQNSKLSSINNFEKIFRLWFGNQTPLGGKEEEEEQAQYDAQQGVPSEDNDPKFDELKISDKFEILYILISYISNYSKFRDYIDKSGLSVDHLRINAAFTSPSATESYLLLFENNRLYKRTISYNALVIPKKRRLAPEFPDEYFQPAQFDINHKIKFEMIYKNIYELDEFINGHKKNARLKPLLAKLVSAEVVDSIFNSEIKKRKFLVNKKKEVQLASLLATRKRSSRLEAKEKQRQEELERQREQEEYELKLAAEKRMERRRLLKEQQMQVLKESSDYTGGMSRDDRIKLRRLEKTPTFTPTPVPGELPENDGTENATPIKEETFQEPPQEVNGEQPQVTNAVEEESEISKQTENNSTVHPLQNEVIPNPDAPTEDVSATEQSKEEEASSVPTESAPAEPTEIATEETPL